MDTRTTFTAPDRSAVPSALPLWTTAPRPTVLVISRYNAHAQSVFELATTCERRPGVEWARTDVRAIDLALAMRPHLVLIDAGFMGDRAPRLRRLLKLSLRESCMVMCCERGQPCPHGTASLDDVHWDELPMLLRHWTILAAEPREAGTPCTTGATA